MKKSKIMLHGLLLISLLLPYIAVATTVGATAATPRYVGISEGQEITYNTEFDDGPLEDYIEDRYGELTDTQMDSAMEYFWDNREYDDDVVAWKIIIIDVDKEEDEDYDGKHFDEDDVDYVKIKVSIYGTEDKADPDGWEAIDRIEKFKIYDDEEKVFADILYEGFEDEGVGLYAMDSEMNPEWPMFFIPKGLDFDDVADEVEEKAEDLNKDDEYSVGVKSVQYFHQRKDVGFDTNREFSASSIEDFDSKALYTDDGLLYYYEWTYDGDIIAKFELSQFGYSVVYIVENWWWMALIAGAVIIGLIVLICIIIKKKR